MLSRKFLFTCLILGQFIFFTASSQSVYADNRGTPDVQLSTSGIYRVSIQSNLSPLVVNRIHSWTVHVETPDGVAVEDAKIEVSGGMPAHKHGFPTTPRITKYTGNGNYLLEGVKFSMPGPWVMHLKITASGKSDGIEFDITL